MADTPTTITCPAGTFTITVRADGSPVHLDKLPCPASPYSLRHEVGVMTGFIALFIIASVVYGIASRSESCIIDYSFGEIIAFCTFPLRRRLLISGVKEREGERGARREGVAVICLGIRGYTYESSVSERVREGGLADGSERFPFVEASFSQCFSASLDALHTITNNLSSPLPLCPPSLFNLAPKAFTETNIFLDSCNQTKRSSRVRPKNRTHSERLWHSRI